MEKLNCWENQVLRRLSRYKKKTETSNRFLTPLNSRTSTLPVDHGQTMSMLWTLCNFPRALCWNLQFLMAQNFQTMCTTRQPTVLSSSKLSRQQLTLRQSRFQRRFLGVMFRRGFQWWMNKRFVCRILWHWNMSVRPRMKLWRERWLEFMKDWFTSRFRLTLQIA